DSKVRVRLGTGNGTLQAAPDVDVGATADFVKVGDFDGDHRQDLAVYTLGDIQLRLGTGTGTFPTAATYQTGESAHTPAVGDLSGDGLDDLAVSTTNKLTVLIGSTSDPSLRTNGVSVAGTEGGTATLSASAIPAAGTNPTLTYTWVITN